MPRDTPPEYNSGRVTSSPPDDEDSTPAREPPLRPFVPGDPDPSETFLTLEFSTEAPLTYPDATPDGWQTVHRSEETIAVFDRFGYAVIEFAPTALRYTVSVPELAVGRHGLHDYLETARSELDACFSGSVTSDRTDETADFDLRLYFIGADATTRSPREAVDAFGCDLGAEAVSYDTPLTESSRLARARLDGHDPVTLQS